MVNEVLSELKSEFESSLSHLRRELVRIRTGRANPSMLEGISVEYYGTATPISQVATVKVPEPRMLTITPWDKSVISDIERAINMSELGLSPNNDGTMIRLPIPTLTRERREDLAKQARKYGEDAKISVRNHRREANETLKSLEKEKEISEDEMHRALDQVQSQTDQASAKADEIVDAKEKEILEL